MKIYLITKYFPNVSLTISHGFIQIYDSQSESSDNIYFSIKIIIYVPNDYEAYKLFSGVINKIYDIFDGRKVLRNEYNPNGLGQAVRVIG